MPRRVALFGLLVAGCHVTLQSEISRPGTIERVRHPDGAIARRPTLVLTEVGRLRLVEPLECPTEEIVTPERSIELVTRPNLATFVVGLIATGAGAVLAVRGATDTSPGSSPYLYGGLAAAGVGLPLAIGPWLGNRTELRRVANAAPTRRPAASEPCGERALAAKSALLVVRGIDVHAAIGRDGVLAISPYELFDAYEQPPSAIEVSATVDAEGGARTVTAVLEGAAIERHARAFLGAADFDARIEPMRLVPGIAPGTLRLSLTSSAGAPAVRIVLPLKNDGPGPAWALRAHVTAPGARSIDGRVMYIGHVPKGAAVAGELLIAVSDATAAVLRNAVLDVSLELRDAHGTAPTTPVRFRGTLLVDAPRR